MSESADMAAAMSPILARYLPHLSTPVRNRIVSELVEALQGAGFTKSTLAEPEWVPKTAWGTDLWGEVMSEPTEEHARQVAKHHGASVYSRAPMGVWIKEES